MPQPFPTEASLPARNEVDLNRDKLMSILNYFSQLIMGQFNRPLRLVVHGGACMLLHPGLYALSQQQHQLSSSLPQRTTTRDVDYIHRAFIREMGQMGVLNAAEKLKACIQATARAFGLGADWMNSDADVALPMATDPSGNQYDPIYTAAIQPNNVDLHTIYRSSNSMLTLISVTPFWAVSLKLVRYTQNDAADICLLLRNGTILSGAQWTPEVLQNWLLSNCWSMGYANYDAQKKLEMNTRINHSIQLISGWNATFNHLPQTKVSAHAAMGGGDVIGGEHNKHSWGSFAVAGPGLTQMQNQPPKSHTPNIRDWLTADPEPKRRSASRGRPSPPQSTEIFIPPVFDGHQPSQAPFPMPLAHSRGASPIPPVEERWSSWHQPSQSRIHQIEEFDKSLGSMLYEGRNVRNSRTGFIPPGADQETAPPSLNRKKEKKKKDKARDRDRQSKWLREPANETDTSSDDEVSHRQRPTGHQSFHIYAPPSQLSVPSLEVPTRTRSRAHSETRPASSQERRRPTPLPIGESLKPIPPTIFIPPGGSFPPTFQPQVYQPTQGQAPQLQRMARPQHLQHHAEPHVQQAPVPHTQRLARPQHLQYSQQHHPSHSQLVQAPAHRHST